MSRDPAHRFDELPASPCDEDLGSGVRRRPEVPPTPPADTTSGAGRPHDRPTLRPPPPPGGMARFNQELLAQVQYDFGRPRPGPAPGAAEDFGRALFAKVQQDFGSVPPPAPAAPRGPSAYAQPVGRPDDIPTQPAPPPYDPDPFDPVPDPESSLAPPDLEPDADDAGAFRTPLQRALLRIVSPLRRSR